MGACFAFGRTAQNSTPDNEISQCAPQVTGTIVSNTECSFCLAQFSVYSLHRVLLAPCLFCSRVGVCITAEFVCTLSSTALPFYDLFCSRGGTVAFAFTLALQPITHAATRVSRQEVFVP